MYSHREKHLILILEANEMKKAEWKVGELVQVPYYCFAPHRYGWNGYLFADGEIVQRRIGVGKNEGVQYAVVKYVVNGKEETHTYKMDRVFKR